MQFEYSELDRTLEALLRSFSDLMGLFNHLLLVAAGDVDQVFRWLRQLQERGYLDADVDLAEFRRSLESERIIERIKDGSWSLTAKGERAIRRDSLGPFSGSVLQRI